MGDQEDDRKSGADEGRVRAAFARQAAICQTLGAPFTGRICGLIGDRLDRTSPLGRRILGWSGNPSHEGDALPLRLAGGLHDLTRSGVALGLSAIYPPAAAPDDDAVWAVLTGVMDQHAGQIDPWLDGPPQTNEIGRSSALMAGLLVLAQRFGLPVSLYELGASAGLNSLVDRYGFRLGETIAGDAGSPVQLVPEWRGGSPPPGDVRVIGRCGVDQKPMDVCDPATRRTLSAYVWADQQARLDRLNAALDLAALDPPQIARADAADWLEGALDDSSGAGACRVVMHTIAFQYFSPETQDRIRRQMARIGRAATAQAPLAWLSYEAEEDGSDRSPVLRLRTWPGPDDAVALARGHPHGTWIEWIGLSAPPVSD